MFQNTFGDCEEVMGDQGDRYAISSVAVVGSSDPQATAVSSSAMHIAIIGLDVFFIASSAGITQIR